MLNDTKIKSKKFKKEAKDAKRKKLVKDGKEEKRTKSLLHKNKSFKIQKLGVGCEGIAKSCSMRGSIGEFDRSFGVNGIKENRDNRKSTLMKDDGFVLVNGLKDGSEEKYKLMNEIKRLDVMVRYLKSILSDKPEILKLMEIIDRQNEKIAELEIHIEVLESDRCGKHEMIINDLKEDNMKLMQALKKSDSLPNRDDWDFLLEKIQHLNEENLDIKETNKKISDDLEKYGKFIGIEKISIISRDTAKIYRMTDKLLKTAKEIIEKKSFCISPELFHFEVVNVNLSSFNLESELLKIKNTVNKIINIVLDASADDYVKSRVLGC